MGKGGREGLEVGEAVYQVTSTACSPPLSADPGLCTH